MNIMIATVGLDPIYAATGTSEGVVFIAAFAAVGLILLFAAGRLTKGGHEPHVAHYTSPRL